MADGEVDKETLRLWQQDYAILIAGKFREVWEKAMKAGLSGQPVLDGFSFSMDMSTSGIQNWIRERGAEFVTLCTKEQKDAVSALLTKKMRDGHTVDELSRLIRPCIGLTEEQSKANVRYYDSIVANLKKEHPRMKPESIRKKALDAAQKYAERQHRQRAFTIARTESAFAYNRGADEGIRQAQSEGFLGAVRKRWCTSGDDVVCDICRSLEGTEIDMDASFNMKGRLLFPGQQMLPPAHPCCACAIEYIEVTGGTDVVPQMKVDITARDSLRTYTRKEIESIAEQTEKIVGKHVSRPSKWSGNIVIDNDHYPGKLWGCDIRTPNKTAPHMLLHEQLHARSISYYKGREYIYSQYQHIEEATVQYMAQEISMAEGLEIIGSLYDDMTNALREIRKRTLLFDTDYEFAKFLIEMPVSDRLDWIGAGIYDKMRMDPNATVGDYQEIALLFDMLF